MPTRSRMVAALLATITVLAVAWFRDPVSTVTASTLPAVRDTFNAGSDAPRAIVFLASGCAACDVDSMALQTVLDHLPGPLLVIVVWEPIAPTDPRPSSQMVGRLRDRRVTQVWDPDHRISDAMRRAEAAHPGSIPQTRLRTGERSEGILYHVVALFPPGARWEATLPPPDYLDGGLARTLGEVERRLHAYSAP